MNLILCFGVVCHLMLIFANKNKLFSQGRLVSRYISYVDGDNILLRCDKEGNEDDQIKEYVANEKATGHDASSISKIMTGKKLFYLSNNSIVDTICISDAADLFRKYAASWFSDEDKCLLILSILEIIKNDEFINKPESKSFGKFIDQSSNELVFSDFMIRILLYTAHNNIDENKQLKCVKAISQSMKKLSGKERYSMKNETILTKHIKNVKDKYTSNTYTWDNNTQTFKFIDKPIFQGIISEKSEKNIEGDDHSNIDTHNNDSPAIESLDDVPENENSNNIDTNILSSISIPKEYRSCRFCQKFKINVIEANDAHSPYLGTCLSLKQEILNHHNVCDRFSPNYSAITTHMLKSKITQ